MRTLLAIVILAALAWSGWWFVQSTARDRAMEAWLAERRAAGWVAEAEDVRVRGFPNRVDTVVTELSLSDPDAGWAWQADGLQVLSLSYKPNHVIAVLHRRAGGLHPLRDDPRHQRPAARLGDLQARRRGSSSTTRPSRSRTCALTGDAGWTAGIGKAILATRQAADGTPFAHDVAFNAESLALPPELLAGIGPTGCCPPRSAPSRSTPPSSSTAPWDRPALEGDNPVLEEVAIRDLSLTWGKLDLRGRGTLGVDAEGFAEGRIDLRARNWEDMLDVAEASGRAQPHPRRRAPLRPRPHRPALRRPQRPRGAARLRRTASRASARSRSARRRGWRSAEAAGPTPALRRRCARSPGRRCPGRPR